MEPTPATEADAPTTKPSFLQGKRLPSAIVASGAAFAMTLAGLGIANAQTDDTPTTPPSSTAPADGEGEGDGPGRPGPGHTHADHHPHAGLSVAAEALGMSTAELKKHLLDGQSIAQVAEAKGVAVQQVVDALVADRTTALNTAVENGRLTREQADARIASLPERMQELVERTRPADGEGERRGPGRGHGHKADPAKIAEALGMTAEELKAGHEAGKSLAAMATERGVDPQKVIDVLVADAREKLAQAVTDGKLTQAEADERSADLVQRITDVVNRTPPADGERRGPGPGRGHRGPGMKANLEAAAGALGLTPEELRTELQAGKSLATIAGERDVDVAKVVEALVADARARLAHAVTDGKLTQAEADERSADLEARITDLVNRVGRPQDGHRPGPGAVAPGDGGDAEAEPATLTA